MNLARMESVMDAMISAGFNGVFLGIETPNPKALAITKKPQNISTREPDYLLNAVRKIQHKGMQVMGGFILGWTETTSGCSVPRSSSFRTPAFRWRWSGC